MFKSCVVSGGEADAPPDSNGASRAPAPAPVEAEAPAPGENGSTEQEAAAQADDHSAQIQEPNESFELTPEADVKTPEPPRMAIRRPATAEQVEFHVVNMNEATF